MHEVSAQGDYPGVVMALLLVGADVNAVNVDGHTPEQIAGSNVRHEGTFAKFRDYAAGNRQDFFDGHVLSLNLGIGNVQAW